MRLADVYLRAQAGAPGAFEFWPGRREFPSVCLPLWDRVAELASRSDRARELVDATFGRFLRWAELGFRSTWSSSSAERGGDPPFDEKLDDVERALPYLERMLDQRPGNDRPSSGLKQILTTGEQCLGSRRSYERAVAGDGP